MKVKMRLGIALLIACLPWLAMAQNDDLYFVPKKEKKAETKTEVRQVTRQTTTNNDNGIGSPCNNGSGKGCDGEDARY